MNDIINYKEKQSLLLKLYHKYWIIDGESEDIEEDKNWLINDIFSYANNYNATMYGYIDKFYNIFKRNIYLKSNEDIEKYISNLQRKKVKIQINIFLGLLTIDERNDLVKAFYSKLNKNQRLNYEKYFM